MKFIVFAAVLLSASTHTRAQQTDTSAVQKPHMQVTGYVDTYYAYSFNKPADKNIPLGYQYTRHNEFNVNLALVSFAYKAEKVRGTFALQAGTYSQANYLAEPQGLRNIYEANAGFRLASKWWLDAGVFTSHIGLESAISKGNWTLTRSMSAENTPYYETGARLTFEPGSKLTVALFVLNGWQNIRDNNSNKAIGTRILYRPSDGITINYSTFNGEARNLPDSAGLRMRYLDNVYATMRLSSKLSLGADVDFGVEESPDSTKKFLTYWNYTLLLRYRMTGQWSCTVRGEYLSDRHGILLPTGTANNFQTSGYSLNMDYAPAFNMLFRVEGKMYSSRDAIFVRDRTLSNNNVILTGSIVISF